MLILNLSRKNPTAYFCGGKRGKKSPFDFKDFSAIYYLESSKGHVRIGLDFSDYLQVLREKVVLKDSECNVVYLAKLLLEELLETACINTRILRILLRAYFYKKEPEMCSEDVFIREVNALFDGLINPYLKYSNISPFFVTSLTEKSANSSIKNFQVAHELVRAFYFFLEERAFL